MTEKVADGVVWDAIAALRALLEAGEPVAAHVASRLAAATAGRPGAVLEIAEMLSPSQRTGLRALPDPLPAVPALRTSILPAIDALDETARQVLLAASVCVDGRVDVLLEATGVTITEALSGPVAEIVHIAAGRFSFTDPAVRLVVHETTSIVERTAIHSALSAAYMRAGDNDLAAWHRALCTLEGDPRIVTSLLRLTARARRAGAAEWAHAVAREAVSHASDGERREAQLAAGLAALDAGLLDDAIDWLRGPVTGSDAIAAQALAPFCEAVARRTGNVPDAEIASHAARLGGTPEWTVHLTAALQTAAWLHAERGDADDALRYLDSAANLSRGIVLDDAASDLRRLLAPGDADPAVSDATRRASLVVDRSPVRSDDLSPLARVSRALVDARADRIHSALGALQGPPSASLGTATPINGSIDDVRPTPMEEAYRRVALAFVLLWTGDLARARKELAAAAFQVPAGLVFGGAAIALARRLDAATDGQQLPTSTALGEAHPTPHAPLLRESILIDRAIAAYLGGRMTESATLLSLAADQAAPRWAGLYIPGLDESPVWAIAGRAAEARHAAERSRQSLDAASPAQRAATRMRAKVANADGAAFDAAVAEATELCRHLESPYERGRTEMVIGRAMAARGQLEEARRHLLAASGLFLTSGSKVWHAACENDLALLPAEQTITVITAPIPIQPPAPAAAAPPAHPATPASDGEPGSELETACRRAWANLLTDREQDVALLVAQGHSNREVAAKLYVSVRTVEVHLGRIFTKLGVPSRVALTVQAHRIAREYRPQNA